MSGTVGLPPDLRALSRVALLAYPAAIRRRHRDEIGRIFRHRWRRLRGRFGARLRFLAFLVGDVAASRPGGGDGRKVPGGREGILTGLLHDLRFGWRGLRRSPAFTLTAVLTLALGVGANAAIFSLVNGVLLEPLPYPEPDRIYRVMAGSFSSARQVEAVRQRFESASAIAGAGQAGFTLREEAPERIAGTVVWPEHFEVFGQSPLLGRALRDEDTRPGAAPVVVLSHRLWMRAFEGDPGVVGRSVALEGEGHARRTVVGVMGAAHDPYPWPTELLVPALVEPGTHAYEDNFRYWLVGRLPIGVSEAEAEAELRTLLERLAASEEPIFGRDAPAGADLVSYQSYRVGDAGSTLLLMLGAVGVVLLIACVNVANLLLARAGGRRAEVAVRAALGAGRARIVRQLLTESVLLSLMGGAGGVLLALFGTAPLVSILPTTIPRQADIGIDLPVLLFALLASVVAGLLFGLAPALRASGHEAQTLRGSDGRVGGRAGARLHKALLAAEVGFAVILLVAAALLGKSLWLLNRVDPGFEPSSVVAMRLAPAADRYPGAEERGAYYERVLERIRSLPGVELAGAISQLPVSSGVMGMGISPDGDPVPEGERPMITSFRAVTPGALEALGARLREGRLLRSTDGLEARPVGLVNARLARELWPDSSPLGEQVIWSTGDPWFTVVGVVEDIHQGSLAESPEPEVYVPYIQGGTWMTALNVVIRHRPGGDVLPSARAAAWEVDDDVPVTLAGPLTELVRGSLSGERGWTVVFGSFAALALVLATIGVFGVTAYLAAQRRHEMGVRVALGASRRDLIGVMVRTGFVPVALGLALGAIGAVVGGRLLSGLLHGVQPADPVVIVPVVAFLGAAALLANLVPALRASRVDPVRALSVD